MNYTLTSAQKQTAFLFLFICFLLPVFQTSAATFTTTGAVNANGKLLPWTSFKAWKMSGVQGIPTRLPYSIDDIILEDSITIPTGNVFQCQSLVFSNTAVKIALTIGAGSTLYVGGDVELKSPDTGNNAINMPQGNLFIDGNLYIGELKNNAVTGTASILVAGPSTSPGLLKVKGNISNIGKFNSTYRVDINNNATLELGGSLTNSNLLTINFSAASTLKFDGAKAQSIPASVTLGNVQIANPEGVFLSGPITTSNLLGNIEVLSGILENNGHSINGRSLMQLLVKNGAKLVLSGSSAFPTGFGTITLEPTSTVTYDGTANQNIAIQTYGNLELKGSTTTIKYKKFLLGNTTAGNTLVAADLMLDLGTLNIGANTLTLKAEGGIKNFNASHYIILNGAGRMVVESIGQTQGARNLEVSFPIGTSANYSPAYITNTGATNTFAVGVENGVVNYATSTPIVNSVVKKTWQIECVNQVGNPLVNLRLQWNTADEGNGFDNQNCYVSHYTSNAWTRSDIYQDATQNAMSASMSNVTSFSPFTVASGSSPLPVELVSFKAVKKDNAVLLNWETASEKNNAGYEILASADGIKFETVGNVASKNGNANFAQRYEYLDKTHRTGLVYYRLKQTDFDGTVSFYATKVVDMGNLTETLAAYPNPFQNQFDLRIQTASAQEVLLQITDLTGKTVFKGTPKVIVGENNIPVRLSQNLPAGMYMLTAKTNDQLYTTRLIKQ